MAKDKVSKSPDKITEKWIKNMKNAVPEIVSGIEGVQEDPGQKAVAAQEKMRQNINEALDSGLWATRRLAVSKAEWQAKTIAKVKQRLSTGVEQAKSKRQKFDTWLVARLNAVMPEISAMPDMTLDDSKARVLRLMDHMAAERYKGT